MTTSTVKEYKSAVFQGQVGKEKAFAKNGKGVYMTVEKNGKEYSGIIDAISGAAVASLGWGDEDVYDIIQDAARKHTYSYPAYVTNQEAEKLAKFYIENSAPGAFASCLWTCSGSESTENALKIMRQYQLERNMPKKVKMISRECSYHGFTMGAMSVGNTPRGAPFKDLMIDQENVCIKMPRCYPYRDMKEGETEEEYGKRLVDTLEKIILDNDPDTICSVIVETVSGSSVGTPVPPKGYLKGLRDICNKYDVLFMLDEVMCGTGRCNPNGKLNCWENFLAPEDAPDIQTVGKTLGSGYVTIAGVLVSPKVLDVFISGSGTILGAQTYHSHALNCATALGIQEKIKREGLTANVFKNGNLMGKMLKEALLSDETNIVGDVRGIGGFWTIELVKNKQTKEPFAPSLKIASRFSDIALECGANVMGIAGADNYGGTWDIICLGPAFIITEEEVKLLVERLLKAVKTLSKQLKQEGAY
ncbi:hypothetical protein HG535_0D00990 [Zygotorulaspora mrakii]|uniref:Aminotransferase class III n=1 Tax=Zygotorulaspora mrakii TaxID=42260 RepID=A0A7H9B185_ZYGMR|nr:uncharacterized protein HG535_0D00990 [Zygotorulaspora mrakii]QLG72391.1 hypothetical protein HG535_0D00990 [Zygotorulaspora mrakii]